MSAFVQMLSHLKGNPGNGFRPEVGSTCLLTGPNCDNYNGYVFTTVEILWCDDLFVVYRSPDCWPVVNKWDHVLAKPLESASSEKPS